MAEGQPTALDDSLQLWASGQHDAAVTKFLAIDWSDPSLFAPGTMLGYPESAVSSFSEAQNMQIGKEVVVLKSLGNQVRNLGKQALSAGDKAKADMYFNSLRQCGAALDRPEHLQILQVIGKSFKKAGG